MPHYTDDSVYDVALDEIVNNCDLMVACELEPANFAAASTAKGGGGTKLAQVAMAPGDFAKANGDTSGRKVTCAAKNGQTVDVDGTMSHIAYLDTVNSVLLHYYEAATPRAITTIDNVNYPAHDLEIRDTVAE